MTHSATSRPYKGFQTPISSEGTKQRSRGEILAALEDRSLTSRTRKKELIKALLEAGPLLFSRCSGKTHSWCPALSEPVFALVA